MSGPTVLLAENLYPNMADVGDAEYDVWREIEPATLNVVVVVACNADVPDEMVKPFVPVINLLEFKSPERVVAPEIVSPVKYSCKSGVPVVPFT